MSRATRLQLWGLRVPQLVRFTSHGVLWLALLTPVIVELGKGWLPTGDDASIAARSHQVFTSHPPLVGMPSTTDSGTGRQLYDPGPLLFWVLAIPVRLDPHHGVLWGAAVVCAIALSLAVEAVWSTGQWFGCAVIALAVADYQWLLPQVVQNPTWNAYLPILFLIASIALAWVTATGALAWWPVLVVVGSVAAQSHLMFTLPGIALVAVAPLVGIAVRGWPHRWLWLLSGFLAASACWLAPSIQNLGTEGNLTALARSSGGEHHMGVAFGLQAVASVGSPSPLWIHSLPNFYFGVVELITTRSAVAGVLVLTLVAAIVLISWLNHYRELSALAVVALVCSLSVLVNFSLIPKSNIVTLGYIILVLWVVSIAVWTVVLWASAVLAQSLLRTHADRVVGRSSQTATTMGILVLAALVAIEVTALSGAGGFAPTADTVTTNSRNLAAVSQIARQIERATPPGPVAVSIRTHGGDYFESSIITTGVAWRLEVDGWQPGVYSYERIYTGLVPTPHAKAFVVDLPWGHPATVRQVPCPSLPSGCTTRP